MCWLSLDFVLTRRAAAQLGTVELKLDWSAPMTLIRTKVEQLLTATDLWDGRTWGVQITDSDEYTVTVRVLVSAKNSGHLSDLRAYMREQLISWIVTEEPWARPAQRIEPRETVTVEKDMSRERIARLAAELAGISGTNEAVAATGTSASHAGTPASAGEQSGAATGGTASAISASGTAAAAPKDPAHAARMVAARRKAKRARRRAMADRQRELAEGGPSASRDETQVISKSALRKIIEAAGNANPQLTQTLTATSIGRGERFFSGSAEADERAAALEGPGEEAYAEREAETRRARERREAHKRREAEALDPEATLALAAVGVEPVVADSESPEAAQDVAEAAGVAAERADDASAKEAAADFAGEAADEKPDNDPEAADSEADAQPDDVAPAEDKAADVQSAPAQGENPADAAIDAGASADSGDSRAVDSQEDSAPAEDAESEGAPAPDAPQETGGEEEAQASSDVELSLDEQETTPIPARETSVKHPVQVPPPVRTGRPVMTDTVQAVAEEARLDAETRPTPTVKPARVSIMDFFSAVAPTGAEADVLRAVTGQIPAIEPREPKAEDAEAAVAEQVATDEVEAAESSASEESAPEIAAPEVEAAQEDAADSAEGTETPVAAEAEAEAGVEATVVMDPVDETLVMPAAAIAEAASEAVKADEDTDSEAASAEEESPAKKETAMKAASTKSGTKKTAAKKGTAKKTAPKKAAAKKTSGAGPATNE